MTTYLSGINPSSSRGLHLGNYFGAVKPHVEFQAEGKCFYFVANIHSLNTIFDPKEVEANTMNVFVEYFAMGIDPDKTVFFVQSDIHYIPCLQTVFNNVVSVAELKRMHAYKDKLQKDVSPDEISMGLFCYPMLMAADILAFKPDFVPVGEDQRQHVEICRDIAKAFNHRYGRVLKIPELYVREETAKVIGIDGERKMSKSLGNDISVFADEETVKKQIMKITTDPARVHPTDPGNPEKNVAFTYFDLMDADKKELQTMKEMYKEGSISDVEIKEKLFGTFMDYFKEQRKKKKKLEADMDFVHDLRAKGAKRANETAESVFEEVKKAVGLGTSKGIVDDNGRKKQIKYDDFAKLDIRIGTINTAEKVVGADKLLRLEINCGTETRQILAGIAEFVKPEDLIGKQIPVLFNLEPRVMKGLESQGMIMAVGEGSNFALLYPSVKVADGSIVR